MKPYIILGTYWPKRWRAWLIGRDITKITKDAGLIPIQDPMHRHQTKAAWCNTDLVAYVRRRTVKNPKALTFHQDGDLDTGSKMDNCLVLWSTNTPTELKVGTKIYRPPARSIILFRNLGCYHRRPENAPRIRWLFRQRVEIPEHINLP